MINRKNERCISMEQYPYDRPDGYEELTQAAFCAENVLHPAKIRAARKRMPGEEMLCDLADLYKLFSDSTRIKILYALLEDELCVCDIAALLRMTQSAVSHQLRTLKSGKLVRARREGKTVFYSLADEHVRSILSMGIEHLEEEV